MPDIKRTPIKNCSFSSETSKQVKGINRESDTSEGDGTKKDMRDSEGEVSPEEETILPTEVCGELKCQKKIAENQTCLQCETCDKWFHSKCVGISKTEYIFIGKTDKIPWICNQCRTEQAGLFKKLKGLEN